jgi:hypothetical protein
MQEQFADGMFFGTFGGHGIYPEESDTPGRNSIPDAVW